MTLFIRETFVNETKGHIIGESDWYEPYTDNRKRLFKSCQREFGRCVSSIYVDHPTKGSVKVGWYFERREEYQDAHVRYDDYGRIKKPETYTRGVWVTFRDTDEERNQFAAALGQFSEQASLCL
jgi:hypothetical protein